MPQHTKVIVTDFDGTITAHDFYALAVERLLTPQDLEPWSDYRAGRIAHVEAMRRIFAKIRAPESEVLKVLDAMQIDPNLAESVKALQAAGWHILVASAGCEWYIQILLKKAGVQLEVHSNPGIYKEGGPLELSFPTESPFYSPQDGIDKAGIVRNYLERGATVVYAGDGFTDIPATLLVRPENRFARSNLAAALREKGEPFQPFSVWSDMAHAVLEGRIAE